MEDVRLIQSLLSIVFMNSYCKSQRKFKNDGFYLLMRFFTCFFFFPLMFYVVYIQLSFVNNYLLIIDFYLNVFLFYNITSLFKALGERYQCKVQYSYKYASNQMKFTIHKATMKSIAIVLRIYTKRSYILSVIHERLMLNQRKRQINTPHGLNIEPQVWLILYSKF